MENNTPKGAFYMLTEELSADFFNECEEMNTGQSDEFRDTYDFYPDAGI